MEVAMGVPRCEPMTTLVNDVAISLITKMRDAKARDDADAGEKIICGCWRKLSIYMSAALTAGDPKSHPSIVAALIVMNLYFHHTGDFERMLETAIKIRAESSEVARSIDEQIARTIADPSFEAAFKQHFGGAG